MASQLDDQPPAAVPESAEGPGACMALRDVLRPSGQFHQEGNEGLHGHRDLRGMALSSGSSRKSD